MSISFNPSVPVNSQVGQVKKADVNAENTASNPISNNASNSVDNKGQSLAFGRQVVPLLRSDKPITREERDDLKAIQSALNESLGPDVVLFEIKNKTNVDAIVNHKNAKAEQAIADNLREIAQELNAQQAMMQEPEEKMPVYPNNPMNATGVNYHTPSSVSAQAYGQQPEISTK